MSLPSHARYVVIGAGVHGLSTAWHLAKELVARGTGSGADIVILDKTGIGAGPSGIACGVIRNNYFQPAMRELMSHSVSVWESDPQAFHYHPVGYLQIAPEVMREDVATIYEQQRAIDYESELIEGAADSRRYMEGIFHDWQARNITAVLHEKRGGYAENMPSMIGLRGKSEALGVELFAPVTVTGLDGSGDPITQVRTDEGAPPGRTGACRRGRSGSIPTI
jgi:glycine/D-amino acid oxidase-like deaminating enzyme